MGEEGTFEDALFAPPAVEEIEPRGGEQECDDGEGEAVAFEGTDPAAKRRRRKVRGLAGSKGRPHSGQRWAVARRS